MSEVELLLETIRDKRESNWFSRQQAVEKLANTDDPRVAAELVRVFLEDPVPQVRSSARNRLDRLDSNWRASEALSSVLPELVTRLQDADSDVRWAAADAVVELRSADAVPALVDMLGHSDRDRRELAEGTLRRLGGPAAEEALAAYQSRQAAKAQTCPRCNKTTSVEKITDYVQGRVCDSCGWSSVWCYECKEAPMTATPEFWDRPGMSVQAWLNCEGCGKRSRADEYIIGWLKSRKLI